MTPRAKYVIIQAKKTVSFVRQIGYEVATCG
jgi:hypothetical protein